jgi:hypothetical protein
MRTLNIRTAGPRADRHSFAGSGRRRVCPPPSGNDETKLPPLFEASTTTNCVESLPKQGSSRHFLASARLADPATRAVGMVGQCSRCRNPRGQLEHWCHRQPSLRTSSRDRLSRGRFGPHSASRVPSTSYDTGRVFVCNCPFKLGDGDSVLVPLVPPRATEPTLPNSVM